LKIASILGFLIFLPTLSIADSKDKVFYYDTYEYASSSELLGRAAKCEVAALKLNYAESPEIFTQVAAKLMVLGRKNGELYRSNKLLEYKLAYIAAKNFYHGRFSVLAEIDGTAAELRISDIYENSECNEFF